jgi:hypothetical protein
MKNLVTVYIEFSFRGKTHSPELSIDLDEFLQTHGSLPSLYPLIASHNDFDLYSYEYEMMQAEPLQFRGAQGQVADFITDGELDIIAFEAAWHENQVVEKLLAVANKHMGIKNLHENPELKQALLAAYQLGQESQL